MKLTIVCEPGRTVSWEEFRTFPSHSIAVDGFCAGPPRSSPDGLRLNINHHEEVDRMATRSSCDQALVLVKLGLFRTFVKDGRPAATLYVNDCDQDVALATYILTHPDHADRPKLKQLVRVEDLLDMSAGLYPFPKRSHLMRQLAWITEPYTKLRVENRIAGLDAKEMRDVIERMHRRIRNALFGRVKEVSFDTRFETLGTFDGWCLVREIGQQARIGLAEKGVQAFVNLVGEQDGTYRYTLGRLSYFIPFPLISFYEDLNRAEGIESTAADRWGGSRTCGGSPRIRGSRLSPDQVVEILRARIAKGNNGPAGAVLRA